MIEEITIYGNILVFVFELIINMRQITRLFSSKPNDKTRLLIKEDADFLKMKSYNTERLILGNIKNFFSVVKLVLIIKHRILLTFFQYIVSVFPDHSPIVQQIIFLCSYMFVEKIIDIPFDLVSTFCIEQRYGFNKTTVLLYISDFIKAEILTNIIIPPAVYAILYIISMCPKSFYIQLFLVITAIQLTLVVLFPILIQPLFNKFEELSEGTLKTRIVELAKSIGFRPSKILTMDGSKRSHHSNAYFIGIFKEKRIVLYDTLIKQTNEDEVVAILCHEFGHWFYNHVFNQICVSLLVLFINLYAFNYFVMFSTDKILVGMPDLLKLMYFSMLTSFMSPLLSLCQNSITRRYERQADVYAVGKGCGEDLKNGLVKIHVENKSNICPDSWYSTYYHSHPTVYERLELIDKEMEKMEKKDQ